MKDLISILQAFQSGIFAILGGVITLFVTNYLKSKGKIYIEIKDAKIQFMKEGPNGLDIESDVCEADSGSLKFKLELYNSAEVPKSIKNMKISCVGEHDEQLFSMIPKDANTRRELLIYDIFDSIEIINVPPKNIIQYKVNSSIPINEIEGLIPENKFIFLYEDVKGKKRELFIKYLGN